MKSFDCFVEECSPMVEAIGQELAQMVFENQKPNPDPTDMAILIINVSRLYSDRVLRLYHSWLSDQLA